MNRIEMIERAVKENNVIRPCTHKQTFAECFTEEAGQLIFWFNTPLNGGWTTRAIIKEINNAQG